MIAFIRSLFKRDQFKGVSDKQLAAGLKAAQQGRVDNAEHFARLFSTEIARRAGK